MQPLPPENMYYQKPRLNFREGGREVGREVWWLSREVWWLNGEVWWLNREVWWLNQGGVVAESGRCSG
jgi:hypothetical protein